MVVMLRSERSCPLLLTPAICFEEGASVARIAASPAPWRRQRELSAELPADHGGNREKVAGRDMRLCHKTAEPPDEDSAGLLDPLMGCRQSTRRAGGI